MNKMFIIVKNAHADVLDLDQELGIEAAYLNKTSLSTCVGQERKCKNCAWAQKSADDNLNKQLPANHPKSLYALVSADGDRKRSLSARSFKSSSYGNG